MQNLTQIITSIPSAAVESSEVVEENEEATVNLFGSSALCHRFSLSEIKDATNNFEIILGHGGEGIIYLGRIPTIGQVAVKLLKSNMIEFKEEIEMVSYIKHPHLVSLHGYCEDLGKKILVYEYMENGSLSNYITKKRRSTICLSWQQRLNICLGAARGLQYLHKETEELPKGIIHRDIKPDNILLDENWVAKISDFGLCKLSHAGQEKSNMITLLKGTSGYYAPEYIKYGSITRKLDVYAFGVVLFEVLCRKMPWDRGDESYYRLEEEDLGLWARENVDPDIIEEISEDCLEAFVQIIGRSLQQNPSIRPSMDDVVMDLECALKCQDNQDEESHPKAPNRKFMVNMRSGRKVAIPGRKVSIPGSVREMIQNIKEMSIKITECSEDEIYAMLKESSMDPLQTIQKLLVKVRKSNEATAELPESNNTIALDNYRGMDMVPFAEIKKSTQNFNSKLLIGRDGFGKIYEGVFTNGVKVAVKRHEPGHGFGLPEFHTEIMVLSRIHHKHIVSLIGYCYEQSEMILVYEFMQKGYLREHLYSSGKDRVTSGTSSLLWSQRLEICIDVAKALDYLHTGVGRIIHRDVKSTNILLDEQYVAKVTGFGISRLGPVDPNQDHVSTNVKGSFGYLDPEYFRSQKLTQKSDVYSFGVVLLEVLCARPAINPLLPREEINLAEWGISRIRKGEIEMIVDPTLAGKINPSSLRKFGETVEKCLKEYGYERPSMTDVLWDLQHSLQLHWTTAVREAVVREEVVREEVVREAVVREADEDITINDDDSRNTNSCIPSLAFFRRRK